jgi:hypothetical protein
MPDLKVYFVHLRRPRSAREDPDERRDDPFYEFGSFGCTGCHSDNLLHPRQADDLEGARLAFIQGGRRGFRLVYLTPPVTVQCWADRCEAMWTPAEMPFKYYEAPVLAWNDGPSDFLLGEQYASTANRTTIEGGLSSRFRSRARPLPPDMAREVIAVYDRLRATAPAGALATTYDEALPYPPPCIDDDRKATYQSRVRGLAGATDGRVAVVGMDLLPTELHGPARCRSARCRQPQDRNTFDYSGRCM